MDMKVVKTRTGIVIDNPPIARFIFDDTRFAPFWTVVRVLLGLSWLQSGWGKFQNPAWMETGAALKGFWTNAVAIPETGKPAIAFDWYRNFLNGMLESGSYVWFAKLIVIGEILIGLALIVGLTVGIAAFFAGFLNWNFIMAGTASSNALLGVAAILLVLAWKTAGYYGLDRYALPLLGTPWTKKQTIEPPTDAMRPSQSLA